MRKESWFRGPLLSALFLALLIGNAPAFAYVGGGAPSGMDSENGNPLSPGGSGECPPGSTMIFDGAYTCAENEQMMGVNNMRNMIPCSVRAKTLAIGVIPVPFTGVFGAAGFAAFAAWFYWDCF